VTASARPRVAVIVPKYGTVGGGERFVYELTERLARDGRYEIHVFANRWVSGPGPVVFHKIPRVPFPRFPRQAVFAWFAGREVEKGGFDLVHAHDRIFRADVFTMHSIPHETWVRDVRKRRPTLFDQVTAWVERRLMEESGCTWHLPVSSIAGEAYRERYRIDPSRMRVLHPGVDLARFSSPDRDACRREVRTRYGIGPSEDVILFVGMNFEVKGLDAVIEAVAKAKAVRADAAIRLLVVGKGNVGKYRSLASSLRIGGDVIFSGAVEKGVEEYYLASDQFILLSKFDTFGMVVLEAMAARLPVILSANVGAKDLVEEGVNGFVLPDGRDADAAAGKILLLLDADRCAAMGEAGFRTASAHTWEHLAETVNDIYESFLLGK
jgi:UDP-glucose:(heptosyl)LPS alpha-1,3-glucosyltransferase